MGCAAGSHEAVRSRRLRVALLSPMAHTDGIRPEPLSHTLSLVILVELPRQHALPMHAVSGSPRYLQLVTVNCMTNDAARKSQFQPRERRAHQPEASQRPHCTHNGPSPPLGVCVCMPANLRYMLRSSRLASADRTLKTAQRNCVVVRFSRSPMQCTRPQRLACTANRTERVSIEDRRFCHGIDRPTRALSPPHRTRHPESNKGVTNLHKK